MPTLVTVGEQFQISATATDSEGSALTYAWTQVYGPADAEFVDATVLQTDCTCPQLGAYRFRLTASDGDESSTADIVIIAQGSGSDEVTYVDIDTPVVMLATATDPELNPPPDTLAYLWRHVTGPDAITIDDVTDLEPTVTLGSSGTYILGVRAYDGEDYAYDEITLSTSCPVGTGSTVWSDTFDAESVGFPNLIAGECFILPGSLTIRDAVAYDTFNSYSVGSTEAVDKGISGGIEIGDGDVFLYFLEGYMFDLFDTATVGPVDEITSGTIRAGSAQSVTSFGPWNLF